MTPMSGTEPTNRSERKVKELISLLQITDEGKEKRFRDPDLGLEEAITKMKADAAAANGADFKAKQAAMKAMGQVDFHFTAPITREDFITERQYLSFNKRAGCLGLKVG